VKEKAGYVLVAAQECNLYMNVVHEAVGFAMTMMQGSEKYKLLSNASNLQIG
jgi:hypothetical protein